MMRFVDHRFDQHPMAGGRPTRMQDVPGTASDRTYPLSVVLVQLLPM